MYVYIFAELLLIVLALISQRSTNKQRNAFLFIGCFIWALIFGLRGYDVGNDTPAYAGFFSCKNVWSGYGTYKDPEQSIEWGYIALNRFLSVFSDSPTFYFLVHGFLLFFVIYYLYRNKTNSVMSLLWLMCFSSMLTVMMVALRQSFSVCFVLLSILMFSQLQKGQKLRSYLSYKYFWLGLIFFVFSISIHRSSILFFPILIIIGFVKFNRISVYIALSSALVIALLFSEVLSEVFDMGILMIGEVDDEKISLLADRYKDYMDNPAASLANILSTSIPVILTTYLSKDEEVNSLSFKCLVVGIVVYLLFSSSPIISRYVLVFIILGYSVVIPRAVNKNPLVFLFYFVITAYYLWRAIVRFDDDLDSLNNTYILYKFFWE